MGKIENLIKKEFDSELLHDEKYLKTKIKSSDGKINGFYGSKMAKEGVNCVCLSILLIYYIKYNRFKLLSAIIL